MAVNVNQSPSKLTIVYDHGLDENGKQKKASKTYGGVKYDASNEDIYDVALTLVKLQENKAIEIHKKADYEISKGI
ncbi:DUF1659 domain-containing protein [Anaerophilus nitritogenes]|uniref:DUF1659 domain-containing protein n=1 Tax=Anaerophilus nitritogenes TaxID=2498136 RepID=UPI00101C0015|nr:DUF1659 domain-containing protein [Anaerophilus nitritogenes]